MSFDLNTHEIFFLFAGVASLFTALFLYMERYSHLAVLRGVRSWALSLFLIGLGFSLFSQNRFLPLYAATLPAQILITLGVLCQIRSLIILLESRIYIKAFYALWGGTILAFTFFTVIVEHTALRACLIAVFYAFAGLAAAYVLFAYKEKTIESRPVFLGGLYVFFALVMVSRAVYFASHIFLPRVDPFPGGGYEVLLNAVLFLVGIFPTMGFVALCSQIYQARFFATERELEKTLREHELILGFALDATVDAVWDFDVATKTPHFFREWEKMLGYRQGELKESSIRWKDILHPEELFSIKMSFAALLKGRIQTLDTTVRIKAKNDEYVWIKIRGIVVERDGKGNPLRLVGTLKNIDVEIRRIEDARKNSLLIDAVFKSASVGILIVDRDKKVLKYNSNSEEFYGLKGGVDFIEKQKELQFLSLLYPHEKSRQVPAAIALHEINKDYAEVVGFLLPHTLEERWLWVSVRYIEALDVAVCVSTDITELIAARDALHVSALELEDKVLYRTAELTQVNQELEAFSYSLSHDIRAPITRAQNWLRNLKKESSERLGERGVQMLKFVEGEMLHLQAMTAAMFRLSHASQIPLSLSKVNLTVIAEEIIEELRLEYPAQLIQASIEPDLEVSADKELVRLLLRNFLENAVKFSQNKEQSFVHVGKLVDENTVSYFVSDNGEGFEMQYADKLFAPFQRLHSAAEFAGLGVGLSIARRIVHRHGGRIRVLSQKGRGTAFYFTLPDAP